MKAFLTCLLWFSGLFTLHAQGPRMTRAGTDKLLQAEEAIINIRLGGGAASTEIELLFRNDDDRMVEGEFVLPLPAGATVSSYALEVNGKLREAVAVEKERARNAYETIKRQMIDPGIVEREAGNVYRTRVFPIPAKGTKRLRIGYVETLPADAGTFLYQLPLKFDGLLTKFRCEIEGAGEVMPKLRGAAPLTFTRDTATNRTVCEAESLQLNGGLELRLPLPAEPEALVEKGAETTFLLSDIFPEIPETKRPEARRVRLFWDASESGAGADRTATLNLLGAWFRELGDVAVDLKWLRERVDDGGIHVVRGGDWSAIRKLIEAVEYAGATSLDGLECTAKQADLAIYCGDGAATLGRTTGLIDRPLLVLHRGTSEPAESLRERVDRTGGVVVKVDGLGVDLALKKMTTLPYRVILVSGAGVVEARIDGEFAPGKPVSVSGRLGREGPIEIAYGVGTEVRVRREAQQVIVASGGDLVRRLWAQRELVALEAALEPRPDEILRHCRRHGLVSDLTSLIVLERFEDHLRYEIPPPEPDLRKEYERVIAQRQQPGRGGIHAAWKSRLAWYERSFPGEEHVLMPRLKQVRIWKNAVESVFEPGELDAKAFGTVTAWHDRVLGLAERRRKLPDAAAYAKWLEEIETLQGDGKDLAATPVAAPPAGKPLVVSVRGRVAQPGQVRVAGKLTLRESVAKAGGTLFSDRLDRVALYRNAGKTVYNKLSKEFEDFELRPGDMVVVEDDSRDWGGHDPFSAVEPSNPANGPAVVEQEDLWVGEDAGSDGAIGAGGGRRAEAGTIQVVDPAETGMPDLAVFEASLKAGDDPHEAYREVLAGKLRPARFHIETARRLFASGHDELATRVLSTLAERGNGSGAARRAFAFWLIEFGKREAADRVLADVFLEKGDCPAMFARAELAGSEREKAIWLHYSISQADSDAFSVIGLTELNRLAPEDHPYAQELAANLPCDLRITVISEFPDTVPQVEIVEPSGRNVAGWRDSPNGGRLTATNGVAEYMIRRAIPGTYGLRISCKADTTFRIALHTNWGRENQKTVRMTRLIEAGDAETVADLDFGFAAGAE